MNKHELRQEKRIGFGLHCWHRGQSFVELAIGVGTLSLLLLLACDFGRMYYTYVTVSNAARSGAQFGAESLINAANSSGIISAVDNDTSNIMLASGSPTVSQCTCVSTATTVSICPTSYDCSDNPGATYVTVTVAAPFTTLGKYPGLSNPVTLSSTTEMQVLQ
jgi:Flp pilus assembly protein TadG